MSHNLYTFILEQNGFNPEDVALEISFTTQNVLELNPDQVLKLYTDKVITLEEVRNWYQENTGMDLEDGELQKLLNDKEIDRALATNDPEKVGDTDAIKKDFDEKLEKQKEIIDSLKEKLLMRSAAEKYDKARLTKEILGELKKL